MSDPIVRLKIVLDDTDPPIWRRVELPVTTDLKDLHRIIQAAMGWDDEHLHEFQVGRQKIGGRVQLGELVASGIKRFDYLYDMGDSWQHTLRIPPEAAKVPNGTRRLRRARGPRAGVSRTSGSDALSALVRH